MKTPQLRVLCLCLALCILFTGCAGLDLGSYFDRLSSIASGSIPFSEMEYIRPDTGELESAAQTCMALAADPDGDFEELIGAVEDFFYLFSSYSTAYYLAYIHYSINMADLYWDEEYHYCVDHSADIEACRDRLMYALAASPHRAELEHEDYFGASYFDSYDGESAWTEAFTALMDQEADLRSEYYRLSSEAMTAEYYSDAYFDTYAPQLTDLFLRLIRLRRQIATEAGYEDYPTFAYDFYYHRDYTARQAETYLSKIETALVPQYRELAGDGVWVDGYLSCSTAQTFSFAEQMAASIGGTVHDAFKLMDKADLYHIEYGENKYTGSFELFLPDYGVPFVFVSPTGTVQDKLTFVHEFGHFCNDYAAAGSGNDIDTAEFFSQGMEYLSLCYVDGTEDLTRIKMADSLSIYVEQAAYARFEQAVYTLPEAKLTPEGIRQLYETTCTAYGFDTLEVWDSRDFVTIDHFFVNPLYIISYVVSNDAAMQLYEMEQAEEGSGRICYTSNLATVANGFLNFLKAANLESPFAEGRLEAVSSTFQKVLG